MNMKRMRLPTTACHMRDKGKSDHSIKPKHVVDMAKEEEIKNIKAKLDWFFLHTSIPIQPTDFENVRSESVFNSVNKAYTCLQLSSIEIVTGENFGKEKFWKSLMQGFEAAVDMAIDFASLLPGMESVDHQERHELFSKCLLPMATLQNIARSRYRQFQRTFLNMDDVTKQLFISHFPSYQLLSDEISKISYELRHWHPSIEELAHICALLFFNKESSMKQSRGNLKELRNLVLTSLEMFLLRNKRMSYKEVEQLYQKELSIANLLMNVSEIHDNVIADAASGESKLVKSNEALRQIYLGDDDDCHHVTTTAL